jgi:iron complex outermembrane recepter protein
MKNKMDIRDKPLRVLTALAAVMPLAAQAQTLPQTQMPLTQLPSITIIAPTLLPGLDIPLNLVPSNVLVLTGKELGRQRHSNIAEALEQNVTGVTVNAAQGNPFQPDVNYRGFTASPLLGVPQGLSVFQDGVRVNEPFGDVVNWDLIPQSAIASVQLIPGSNPVFGLNTLGGALAVQTKSGTKNPGGSLQTYGGSFGRRAVEFEQGGKKDAWDYFVTGNVFNDKGWAEHNPSRVQQFFGKLGYHTSQTHIESSMTLADNTMEGTQALPLSFADDTRKAYTFPDQTQNKLGLLNLQGSHTVNEHVLLGGNVYYRRYRSQNFSSNVNGNFGEVDATTGLPSTLQATNDRAAINQNSYGLGLQLTYLGDVAGKTNQLVVGASIDLGRTRYTQESQDAAFTANRATVGVSDFALATNAQTRNRYDGLFFTDTLTIDPRWTLTASGRYNLAHIQIADETGLAPGLNGEHRFSRLNPAVGINFNPTPQFTAYAAYNEGMRAPTPIELTCANPDAPCKLPNNFVSDPPLSKVVSKTLEMGVRGQQGVSFTWSAAVYRTELQDDIQFISSQSASANTGYFQNVGKTRRQGIELAANQKWGPVDMSARYAYLDATYQSSFTANSPVNTSANADGSIAVQAGNHIPNMPRHSLKLRLNYEASAQWSLGMNLIYSGSAYVRGDENNQDLRGKLPGYSVINLDTRYQFGKNLELFARVNNLLDKQYANFGVLAQNFFTGPGRTFDGDNPMPEQFRGFGAPRGAWVGLRYRWD